MVKFVLCCVLVVCIALRCDFGDLGGVLSFCWFVFVMFVDLIDCGYRWVWFACGRTWFTLLLFVAIVGFAIPGFWLRFLHFLVYVVWCGVVIFEFVALLCGFRWLVLVWCAVVTACWCGLLLVGVVVLVLGCFAS